MKGISYLLFFIAGCSLTTVSCNQSNSAERKIRNSPNIVLIIGDDHGYPYFGFMGADYMHTPNMDSLAESGVLFSNGFVPANHCRPSLQTLITGELPINHFLRVDSLLFVEREKIDFKSHEVGKQWERDFRHQAMKYFKTLPKILSKHGYTSFQGGKWWEFHYRNGGFDNGMTIGWTSDDRRPGGKWFKKFMGGKGLDLARLTMEPVYEFIDANLDRPFFIWYAPELPHYPFDAPRKYYDLYTENKFSESAKRYYANCSWFDDGVGSLINHIEDRGLHANTLFIYVNDNGWEQNPQQEFRHDSMRWHNGGDKGKLGLFDQSFRTPIIFSWAGQLEGGRKINELVHSADIPATILDFVGERIPSRWYGRSLKEDIVQGQAINTREIIIGRTTQLRSQENMMGRKVDANWLRTDRWFFTWNFTDSEKCLFDMTVDQRNEANLVDQNSNLVADFSKKIMDWRKSHESGAGLNTDENE